MQAQRDGGSGFQILQGSGQGIVNGKTVNVIPFAVLDMEPQKLQIIISAVLCHGVPLRLKPAALVRSHRCIPMLHPVGEYRPDEKPREDQKYRSTHGPWLPLHAI